MTSLRRIHVSDRMERVIDYFETVPFFKLYWKRTNRQPGFLIELRNGHIIYGVSFGDDPEARTAVGRHASLLITEESQQVPIRAWVKLQGAKDPRHSRTLMVGVPDGRLDTPFRLADDKWDSFRGRRFHLSRRHDPFWDRKTKQSYVDMYNGEDSDVFRQEIDAQWGNPAWSAWDMEAIFRCVVEDLDVPVLKISGAKYRNEGLGPEVAIQELPGPLRRDARILLAGDVGYSQPTSLLLMEEYFDKGRTVWRLIARVELINRMEHNDQAKIIAALGMKYGVQRIGLDTSEGEGRAIATELEETIQWRNRVVRVDFREIRVSGYTSEGEEVEDASRDIGTKTLRSMFNYREVQLPRDDKIMADFNSEMEHRDDAGKTKIKTPKTVHITDAFRVFGVMVFLEHPPAPPVAPGGEVLMPEWGGGGPWGVPAGFVL